MKIRTLFAAVSSAAFLSVGAASIAVGAPVTFNLGSGGGVPSDPTNPTLAEYDALPGSFSLTSGNLSLNVAAQSYSAISAAAAPGGVEVFFVFGREDEKVGRFAEGAGNFSSPTSDHLLSSSALAGFEYLLLTFSRAVSITELAFGEFSGGDDFFNIIEDRNRDDAFGAGDLIGFDQPVGNGVPTGSSGAYTTWGILAPGVNSSWLLESVTVAPVPLPAAGWLLLAGLGGLFAARCRQG